MSETLDMVAFGPFRLDVEQRRLSRAGVPVALSSRAFDILATLVEHRGRVVSKDEIMTRVWRGMIVEENNLAVQISALRRALGDGAGGAPMILTVPGHGYRFVGRLQAEETAPEAVVAELPPVVMPPVTMPPAPVVVAPAAAPVGRVWRSPMVTAALVALVVGLLGADLLRPVAPPARVAAPAPVAPRLSIAVLPFRDLSDDRCCDYLADAISDDVTTDLSLIPGSVVIARESADVFRGHPAPADAIGRRLNVRYLLEGSLRAVEGNFSVNAQLIEASSGAHLWAERFSVPRAHLGDAQAAIVQRLASALGVKLVDIEGARSLREHADAPDALDLFLRARSVLDRSDTLESMDQAQGLLEQALVKAPDDVRVLSELGWLLTRKNHNYVTAHRDSEIDEARRVIAKAMVIAPHDPAILAGKAALQFYDGNCADAQLTFQLALDGQPNSVRALTGLTACQFHLGRFADAVSTIRNLIQIDPEGPGQRSRFYEMGFAQLMLARPDDALPWLRRAVAGTADPKRGSPDLGPDEWLRLALIAAERLAGHVGESDALFASYQKVWPSRSTWSLESRSPRIFSKQPGFRQFILALEGAGMERFSDERSTIAMATCGVDEQTSARPAAPGFQSIDTPALAALLKAGNIRIVDFGVGAAVPALAQLSLLNPASPSDMAGLATRLRGEGAAAIVTMGSGSQDARGCQAAGLLVGAATPVYWYRGGEEAWAKAGLPSTDQR
jgi:TolB-like protein/DNA-binding winged helix-turn-helix (wHTH) protein/cytochrome c-type biogenesis protein CcmH/NrfG